MVECLACWVSVCFIDLFTYTQCKEQDMMGHAAKGKQSVTWWCDAVTITVEC